MIDFYILLCCENIALLIWSSSSFHVFNMSNIFLYCSRGTFYKFKIIFLMLASMLTWRVDVCVFIINAYVQWSKHDDEDDCIFICFFFWWLIDLTKKRKTYAISSSNSKHRHNLINLFIYLLFMCVSSCMRNFAFTQQRTLFGVIFKFWLFGYGVEAEISHRRGAASSSYYTNIHYSCCVRYMALWMFESVSPRQSKY